MNSDGGSCFPGLNLLIRETRLARATIVAAIRELEEGGLLEVARRPGRVNRYRATSSAGELVDQFSSRTAPVQPVNGTSSASEPEDAQEDVHKPTSGGAQERARPGEHVRADGRTNENSGAQQLVAGYVNRLREQGASTSKRLVGQVAARVGELLDDGVPASSIAAALELLIERRLHPTALASLIPEAELGPRGTARTDEWKDAGVYDRA
jgi:DNA-binding MarR family transcriptional regulator